VYKNKIIFIAPLDWGLGHATRCVPLIKKLSIHNTIILGITPLTQLIFDNEFPELKKIQIEPYGISYSKRLPILLVLMLNYWRIKKVIKKEHTQLKQIVSEHHIDIVISDNRLGLYHSTVESIYITHQLTIQAGIFSRLANNIHQNYIKKYKSIWIPDFENEEQSLAGKLSRTTSLKNSQYIGPLSRLERKPSREISIDYLFLLSGPEPQRTNLESALIDIANKTTKKIVLVRGTNQTLKAKILNHITLYDLPDVETLSQLITHAENIICRSGYSTLMDLHHLQKTKLILIPTPSQTEQIYLAKYWQQKFDVRVVTQSQLKRLEL
jgi:UDP-N-acetylglucosamine:LPS N-acetylglucosamine transferase